LLISLRVLKNGDIRNIKIISSTDELIDEFVAESISGWVFKPAMKEDKLVTVAIVTPLVIIRANGKVSYSTEFNPYQEEESNAQDIKETNELFENRNFQYPYPKTPEEVPKIIESFSPVYPPNEKGKRVRKEVILEVAVLQDGSIGMIEVKKSAGENFDIEAIKAVKKFIIEPAKDAQGNPVACWISLPIRFN